MNFKLNLRTPNSKINFIERIGNNVYPVVNKEPSVKKIVNVYQLQYKNSKANAGFGDFLRGCFCLIQICNIHGLDFDIDVSNHPISKYINNQEINPTINYNEILRNTIEMYYPKEHDNNKAKQIYTLLVNEIRNENSEIYYMFMNSFPFFKIKQIEIDFIKSRIEPNLTMQTEIDLTLNELNLISKEFSVIHIRSGDRFLVYNSKTSDNSFENELFKYLEPLLNNQDTKYLIISDNYKLKLLFSEFKNCVFSMKPITHLGHSKLNDDNVKNTLIDFYLMSQSKNIYAISNYDHGSGFSKWCSVIYNIPYNIKIIN